jgi:hypothetical protein
MEHNIEWYDKIKAIAKELKLFNIDFNLYPLADERYYTHIHNTGAIDFIIIDGRNRVRCFEEAIKLSRLIMLDDSERERYQKVFTYNLKFIVTLPNAEGQRATIFHV